MLSLIKRLAVVTLLAEQFLFQTVYTLGKLLTSIFYFLGHAHLVFQQLKPSFRSVKLSFLACILSSFPQLRHLLLFLPFQCLHLVGDPLSLLPGLLLQHLPMLPFLLEPTPPVCLDHHHLHLFLPLPYQLFCLLELF